MLEPCRPRFECLIQSLLEEEEALEIAAQIFCTESREIKAKKEETISFLFFSDFSLSFFYFWMCGIKRKKGGRGNRRKNQRQPIKILSSYLAPNLFLTQKLAQPPLDSMPHLNQSKLSSIKMEQLKISKEIDPSSW